MMMFADTDNRAFTLIELMVAVSILAVLVMIVGAVFQQSTVAWNSGTQRMEANVMARAVLDFMAEEISHAVASDEFICHVDTRDPHLGQHGFSHIAFWTLLNTNNANERVARYVHYHPDLAADAIVREEWILPESEPYGEAVTNISGRNADSVIVLATNVSKLLFHGWPPQTGWGGKTNLPHGVRIQVQMKREDDISNVEARSFGPDGVEDTDDDIGTW